MTLDYEVEDSVIFGKDLKAGDCIRDSKGNHSAGIIIGINHKIKFYRDKPHYEFFDINDSNNGPMSGPYNPEEKFTVINSRKEIIRYYDVVELALLRQAANCVEYRKDLIKVKSIAIDRINNKLDILKKLKDNKE